MSCIKMYIAITCLYPVKIYVPTDKKKQQKYTDGREFTDRVNDNLEDRKTLYNSFKCNLHIYSSSALASSKVKVLAGRNDREMILIQKRILSERQLFLL